MSWLSKDFLLRAVSDLDPRVEGELPGSFTNVGTDSRAVQAGELFVAIRGERFDAHAFVKAALEQGAGAALTDELGEPGEGTPRLVVKDSLLGLQAIAALRIKESGVKRVALTGSNGKTSTKELIAAVLGAGFGKDAVIATRGNLNNHIGVPLTAFTIEDKHEVAVFEMGMNHLGEIARLCEIVRPEIGLVTNIGTAHAGNVGGPEGVAKAKGELFAGMDPEGIAVVNQDDTKCVAQAAANFSGQTLRFGESPNADIRLVGVEQSPDGLSLRFAYAGEQAAAHIPYLGAHNAQNAAAAVAVGIAAGLSLEEACEGLATAEPPAGRLRPKRAVNGAYVLDDTYNANPDSMKAAFATLAAIAPTHRRVAVLGDMLELGDGAPAAHSDIGAAAVKSGITRVFACGTFADDIARGARAAGLSQSAVITADNSAALAPLVKEKLASDDAAVVKGSRGARMEVVVDALTDANSKNATGGEN